MSEGRSEEPTAVPATPRVLPDIITARYLRQFITPQNPYGAVCLDTSNVSSEFHFFKKV